MDTISEGDRHMVKLRYWMPKTLLEIAAERLLILEKGQEGWACPTLTEGK